MYLDKIEEYKIIIIILSIYNLYLLESRKIKRLLQIFCLKYISIKMYLLKIRYTLSEIMVYILKYIFLKLVYSLLFNFKP